MDIEYLSKNYSKEQIYRIYEAVSETFKKYNQITRKQCLLKIQEAYKDKEILKRFITDHEFQLLRKVYEEKRVAKTFVYEELINRFFLVNDENISYIKMNPDLEDVLSELLENKIERMDYDRYDEIIIGLVNYFGAISYEELFEFIKIYAGEYDEETMFDHVSTSPIINYLFLCPEEYVICRYDLFEDYAQIMLNRRNLKHQVILPEMKELISFGHYGFNIYDPSVQIFFELLFKMYYFQQSNLVYNMMKDAHLGESFDGMRLYLKSVLEFNEDQIDIFEKAYETLPCASNYGIPLKFLKVNEDSFELESVVQENAHLSESDAELFYECYLSLLEFVNDKYHVCPHIKKIVGVSIEPSDVVEIRKVLIEHIDEIDEFVRINHIYFNEDELQIIKNFKLMKFAHYVVVKYEKDYTVFMDGENFYAVKGARGNISEMLEGIQLPVLVDALLLPFDHTIIVDGVLQSYPIHLGDGYNNIILENLKKARIQKQLVHYN